VQLRELSSFRRSTSWSGRRALLVLKADTMQVGAGGCGGRGGGGVCVCVCVCERRKLKNQVLYIEVGWVLCNRE
jgi:hypothetical protein